MRDYIIVTAGIIVFLAGYYFYSKRKDNLTIERVSGLVAYAGLSMVIISGTKLLTPIYMTLFGNSGVTVRTVSQVLLFLLGAELILKPVFEDQLFNPDGTKKSSDSVKKITPNGTKNMKKKK